MKKHLLKPILLVSVLFTPSLWANPLLNLQMALNPATQSLQGKAHFHLDTSVSEFQFSLHHNLKIETATDYEIVKVATSGLAAQYRLVFSAPVQDFSVVYEGVIAESVVEGQSPGVISESGVSLLSESYFYPSPSEFFNYVVDIELPNADWKAIVPGVLEKEEPNHFRYRSFAAAPDLALVADRFHSFETKTNQGTTVRVWLRSADPVLAQQFLSLVPSYIERYSQLIGPFPFSQYSVIENSLETGYAFPGFTLLGPAVIRLPFILRSSLPHEVLHSWWGHSVLVDYAKGNWCEGLTTHMADHAFRIEDMKGAEYRRSTLQSYQDFVSTTSDFPVRKFIARNDRGTQAVGYGKTMMIFAMLENLVGAEHFQRALAAFYKINLNRSVGFAEIQDAFEKEMNVIMDAFFLPWLDQTGAPKLSLVGAKRTGYDVEFTLQQAHSGSSSDYVLPILVNVSFEDGSQHREILALTQKSQTYRFAFSRFPVRLQVDPNFEVFRTLYPEETPISLSQVLGEDKDITVSIPALEKDRYQDWVSGVQKLYKAKIHLILDSEPYPTNGVVWIIGAGNLHGKLMQAAVQAHKISIYDQTLVYNGASRWSQSNASVFMVERVGNVPSAWAWTTPVQAGAVLMAKVGHYSGFSMLGFTDLKNDFKELWSVETSPLTVNF